MSEYTYFALSDGYTREDVDREYRKLCKIYHPDMPNVTSDAPFKALKAERDLAIARLKRGERPRSNAEPFVSRSGFVFRRTHHNHFSDSEGNRRPASESEFFNLYNEAKERQASSFYRKADADLGSEKINSNPHPDVAGLTFKNETKFQSWLIKTLEGCGMFVFNVHGHGMQKAGMPDLYVASMWFHGWIELKHGIKGQLRGIQKTQIKKLRSIGVPVMVLHWFNGKGMTVDRVLVNRPHPLHILKSYKPDFSGDYITGTDLI